MNTMSAWPGQGQGQGHGKRKEPDDFVSDLLSSFTLSPPKRARTAVAGHRVNGAPGPVVPVASALLPSVPENAVAAPVLVPAPPPLVQVPAAAPAPAPAPVSVSVPAALPLPVPSEERAIVLYRPVNPPLFPGGPPVGSSELPIQFNTSFMDSKAFDFSGTVDRLPQRLSRASSRSALPYLPSHFSGQVMSMNREDTADSSANNNMAVIPWVPLQFPLNNESAGEAAIEADYPEIDAMDVTMEEAPSYSNATFSTSFGGFLPQVYGS